MYCIWLIFMRGPGYNGHFVEKLFVNRLSQRCHGGMMSYLVHGSLMVSGWSLLFLVPIPLMNINDIGTKNIVRSMKSSHHDTAGITCKRTIFEEMTFSLTPYANLMRCTNVPPTYVPHLPPKSSKQIWTKSDIRLPRWWHSKDLVLSPAPQNAGPDRVIMFAKILSFVQSVIFW